MYMFKLMPILIATIFFILLTLLVHLLLTTYIIHRDTRYKMQFKRIKIRVQSKQNSFEKKRYYFYSKYIHSVLYVNRKGNKNTNVSNLIAKTITFDSHHNLGRSSLYTKKNFGERFLMIC